jgi:uncharacterized surface protein with fasciclin (FAS1) repeats
VKRIAAPFFALALLFAMGAAPAQVDAQEPFETSIIDVLSDHGEFETFLTALQTAGFDQALAVDGPYTVFAPTDAAFEALPEGQLEALLQDPEALAGLLGYHLVPGEYDTGVLEQTSMLESAFGEALQVTAGDGVIQINSATVVDAGNAADNGIIHAVDEVLMTP